MAIASGWGGGCREEDYRAKISPIWTASSNSVFVASSLRLVIVRVDEHARGGDDGNLPNAVMRTLKEEVHR